MPKKKPVTTKKGQHHKHKSFMMNLVKDKDISKVDTNVLRKHKESFEKKKVTFEKRNPDPAHFHDVICHGFPSVNGMEFSLWRLPMNKSTLIPFPKNIDNAVALCNYEDLNRSVIYIRLMAAPDEAQVEVHDSSNFCESNTNQQTTSHDDDEEAEEQMEASMSTEQIATSDDDEETEDQMEASVSTEQTMPEHTAKKRRHLSESEDQNQKRKSHSTGMKCEGFLSSLGAFLLEEDGHEVESNLTTHSCETSAAVANISSVCIDAGSDKNLNPQDTVIPQMTPVPVFSPVMNSQPTIFNQFSAAAAVDDNFSSVRIDAGSGTNLNPQDTLIAQQMTHVHGHPFLNPVMNCQPSSLHQLADVATNTITAASLPNGYFHNFYQEPFGLQHPLNAQSTRSSFSNFLHPDSIYQPNLQNQLLNSYQIQRFHSNGFNENYPPYACNSLQQQVNGSGQLQAHIVQNVNQFQNLQNVYNLSTTGRQDSNMQPFTTSNSTVGQHNINSGEASIEVPKAELIGEFDCNLYSIIGLAELDKRLYFIRKNSDTVTIHSSHNPFEKITDHEVKGMKSPLQIFASPKNTGSYLYILDGDNSGPKCIWKATDGDEFIAKRLMENVNCCCLSVTHKGDLFFLDDKNYCLHLYNSDSGRCFHCIHLSKINRKEFGDPHFVISSLDDAFYISLTDDKAQKSMIYKISCDGELLNTFGGRSGKGSGQLGAYRHRPLILDRYGRVIVLDNGNDRVLLLNSNLEYIAVLLSDFIIDPIMCYDGEDRLFTSSGSAHVTTCNVSQFGPDNLMKIAIQKPSKFDEGLNKTHLLGNISMMTCNIRGVAMLLDRIYILTSSSIFIHYYLNPFKRIHLKEFESGDFWDIAADDWRLYITDKAEHCIWLMGIDLRKTKWLQSICSPYSLSVSKDGSVVIPNNREQSIDIYKGGKTAVLQMSIKLSPSLNRVKLQHAIKVKKHYVVCHGCLREDFEDANDEYFINKVLCVSTHGDVLRSFEDLSTAVNQSIFLINQSTKLYLPNHLAVDRKGGVIVADSKNKRVVRLNGKLEQGKILMSNKTEGIEEPQRLSYDRKNDQLLVCYSQSLDIFSLSLEIQKRNIDPKLPTGIKSLDLCQDVCGFECQKFQKISEVDAQTMKYKDKQCFGVAILREQLYLLISDRWFISGNVVVSVHQSDPPFDMIGKVQILEQSDVFYCDTEAGIVASSAHDRCYVNYGRKIYSVINGSQTAEEFLESIEGIRSMSVTAEGQLLVVHWGSRLVTYNYNGECTGCIFHNDNENWFKHGVKVGEGRFICGKSCEDSDYLTGIYERSVDGSEYCFYGPFDIRACPYECKAMTLGEDGQVFILSANGEVLCYDYKRHLLSIRLKEDDHKMSDVTGFCYSREKKQLLVCGKEGITVLEMLQNTQNEQSSEGLESIQQKENSSNDKEIDKSSRLLYSVLVTDDDDYQARGIARLGNNTYLLHSSELLVINSKDIRKNNFSDLHHSLTIPEPHLGLIEGGLRDIAASHVVLCLYVTDKRNRCVWSVTIDHKINKWLDDIDSPYTLSVTEDGSVCLLDNSYKQLDIYDSNAVRRKSIRLPRFMTSLHLRHAVQTSLGNFVVCCNTKNMDEIDDDDGEYDDDDSKNDDDDNSEDDVKKQKTITESSNKSQGPSESLLCEISPEGTLIRCLSSTEESTPSSQLLADPLHLAVGANDRIFVIDCQRHNRRILLFDNQLKCIETNITNEISFEDASSPRQLFYDSSMKELLVMTTVTLDGDCHYHILMCLKNIMSI